MAESRQKTAVVLFNLGGPDGPRAVRPFLFNLFNDPAIIRLPGAARWLLAQFISRRREKTAQAIYAKLGGASPLLAQTREQASALETALSKNHRVFIAMRYWHPFSSETVREVIAWRPDRIVLIPLYPQFSTTTTASSLADWERAARAGGLDVPTSSLCCYPTEQGYVAAQAAQVRQAIDGLEGDCRVLFSAHGLPKKIVEAGDPYQWQVEQNARAVADEAGLAESQWRICYQSRVGRLEWIGPSTEEAIEEAAVDGIQVVVVPTAFVSEHSETLVELDIEYRGLADKLGLAGYHRVPTLGTDAGFISTLADLVRRTAAAEGLCPASGKRYCPDQLSGCPCGR